MQWNQIFCPQYSTWLLVPIVRKPLSFVRTPAWSAYVPVCRFLQGSAEPGSITHNCIFASALRHGRWVLTLYHDYSELQLYSFGHRGTCAALLTAFWQLCCTVLDLLQQQYFEPVLRPCVLSTIPKQDGRREFLGNPILHKSKQSFGLGPRNLLHPFFWGKYDLIQQGFRIDCQVQHVQSRSLCSTTDSVALGLVYQKQVVFKRKDPLPFWFVSDADMMPAIYVPLAKKRRTFIFCSGTCP